ncbi:MAG: cyclic nucleotide-binding domain-containing protein [Verrucomicrobiales bacterium]|nr:cyclic nucleotide-binding domain-containing protein [Verrucomicrobiales bacterium]
MERDQLINLLKKNEAFGAAPTDAIENLVDAGEIRSIEAGTALLHQGATGESIWMLLSGTLEVLVNNQIVKTIHTPGEVFGEISAVSLTPATATVQTADHCSTFCIPHGELHRVMKTSPDLAAAMLRSMAKYLGH